MSYDKDLNENMSYANKLSHILAEHIELSFSTADLTLRRVIERNYFNDLFGGNISEDLMHNIRKWVDETPQISAMLVIDENGQGLLGAHKKGYENWIDYNDLDFEHAKFFQQMQILQDRFLWISKIKTNDNTNKELLFISRRISKINGEFGGLVVAAIDPAYFISFFKSIQTYKYSQMQVRLGNDKVLIENAPADRQS